MKVPNYLKIVKRLQERLQGSFWRGFKVGIFFLIKIHRNTLGEGWYRLFWVVGGVGGGASSPHTLPDLYTYQAFGIERMGGKGCHRVY